MASLVWQVYARCSASWFCFLMKEQTRGTMQTWNPRPEFSLKPPLFIHYTQNGWRLPFRIEEWRLGFRIYYVFYLFFNLSDNDCFSSFIRLCMYKNYDTHYACQQSTSVGLYNQMSTDAAPQETWRGLTWKMSYKRATGCTLMSENAENQEVSNQAEVRDDLKVKSHPGEQISQTQLSSSTRIIELTKPMTH